MHLCSNCKDDSFHFRNSCAVAFADPVCKVGVLGVNELKAHLEFIWKYKNYELRACPKRLARFDPDEQNETIDLVLWQKDSKVKDYCFSLAYFKKDSEGYYLKFVGNRPFQYIAEEDVPYVWKALNAAQTVLDAFFDIFIDE